MKKTQPVPLGPHTLCSGFEFFLFSISQSLGVLSYASFLYPTGSTLKLAVERRVQIWLCWEEIAVLLFVEDLLWYSK